MTAAEGGGRARPVRILRAFPIVLGALAAGPTLASDGDLQRALLEQGCLEPRIETILQQRSLVAYRANCLGSAHKTIVIVCSDGGCRSGNPVRERNR